MEELMSSLSMKIEHETKKLSKELEYWQKKLIIKSYSCMSDCFKSDNRLKDCERCSKKCQNIVNESHSSIQKLMDNVQDEFAGCIKKCSNNHGETLNSGLKDCLNNCATYAIRNIQDVKEYSVELLRSKAES